MEQANSLQIRLVRRARLLVLAGMGYNTVEGVVAVASGVAICCSVSTPLRLASYRGQSELDEGQSGHDYQGRDANPYSDQALFRFLSGSYGQSRLCHDVDGKREERNADEQERASLGRLGRRLAAGGLAQTPRGRRGSVLCGAPYRLLPLLG